jgi:hypothetical protein
VTALRRARFDVLAREVKPSKPVMLAELAGGAL